MSKNYKDGLGDRMKTYEYVARTYLTRRTPVIIRLDGCHFHTMTKGLNKPFDEIFCSVMQKTMKYLCENIQNCVLGYTQSDEITLVLCDYKKLTTAAWFDNNIQKMASVSASMATMAFNKFLYKEIDDYSNTEDVLNSLYESDKPGREKTFDYFNVLHKVLGKGAIFDSRVFNIPKEEVCNCLIWRQKDATRNSIQGLGQKYFSHKHLEGKKCNDIQDMLMIEKGVNWNDIPTKFKRGCCAIKIDEGWVIDNDIPIFTQNREYIENRIVFNDE